MISTLVATSALLTLGIILFNIKKDGTRIAENFDWMTLFILTITTTACVLVLFILILIDRVRFYSSDMGFKIGMLGWHNERNFGYDRMALTSLFGCFLCQYAAIRKILSPTRAILAMTLFCHLSLSMCQWSLGGLEEPKGGTPLYMKKLQYLKLIFRPFGTKKKY